jgi:hypothetical protein
MGNDKKPLTRFPEGVPMRKALALTAAITALALSGVVSVKADVIVLDQGGSTGDLVVFDTKSATQVVGSFNGQHQGLVDFNCLTLCVGFTGAQSGNDLKINNFGSMSVQVFDSTGTTVLPTARDIFSITATAGSDVTLSVVANESGGGTQTFTFDLLSLFGPLGPGQNFFSLTAVNGETINQFTIADTGGVITDYEHYRVEVAAVPGPIVGAGIPGLLAACCGMFGLNRFRRKRRVA